IALMSTAGTGDDQSASAAGRFLGTPRLITEPANLIGQTIDVVFGLSKVRLADAFERFDGLAARYGEQPERMIDRVDAACELRRVGVRDAFDLRRGFVRRPANFGESVAVDVEPNRAGQSVFDDLPSLRSVLTQTRKVGLQ